MVKLRDNLATGFMACYRPIALPFSIPVSTAIKLAI